MIPYVLKRLAALALACATIAPFAAQAQPVQG